MPSPLELELTIASPERLDLALLRLLRAAAPAAPSRARLKSLLESGAILVDGRPARAARELAPGRYRVTVFDPAQLREAQAQAAPGGAFLPVVYQDQSLLVLNKSSGVPSIPHASQEVATAVSSALAWDPALATASERALEPGLLHRLDTGTSGLLAFARTPEAYGFFHRLWKERRVRKIYRALAAPLKQSARDFELTLAHDSSSAKRMRVLTPQTPAHLIRGKAYTAITHISKSSPLTGDHEALRDHEIEIETGVMHQIRCTLAHLGSPILGDPIYGGPPSGRLWLHAWRLVLPLANGSELALESALPPDWPVC